MAARLRAASWKEVTAVVSRPGNAAMGVHTALVGLCCLFNLVHMGDAPDSIVLSPEHTFCTLCCNGCAASLTILQLIALRHACTLQDPHLAN